MLRVITQSLCSKFLTVVLGLSPRSCSPVLPILAEAQSLTEDSARIRILGRLSRCGADPGGDSPKVQSSWSLLTYCPVVMMGSRNRIWSEWCHWVLLIRCSLGCSGDPDWVNFTRLKAFFPYSHSSIQLRTLKSVVIYAYLTILLFLGEASLCHISSFNFHVCCEL